MRFIHRITLASLVLAGLLLIPALKSAPTNNADKEMSDAAEAFLASLSADQRARGPIRRVAERAEKLHPLAGFASAGI